MSNIPTLKQIKILPMVVFVMLSLFFLMILYQCYNDIGRQMTLDARLMYDRNNSFKEIVVKGNKFHTGWEGQIYWKPRDIKEAILINLASTDQFLKFYDLFYMLILNIVLFITINKMKEETVFSDNVIKGFTIIVYFLAIDPFLDFANNMFNQYFMKILTHNVLTAPFLPFSGFRLMLSVSLIGAITFLFSKGKSLQKEQDLTI